MSWALWSYITKSSDPELNGKKDEFLCVKQIKTYLHGPLYPKGYHFIHADGTPRFLISTRLSCQFASLDVLDRVIEYLKPYMINRILFMMGGVHGTIKELYGNNGDFWRYMVKGGEQTIRLFDREQVLLISKLQIPQAAGL